MITKLLLARFLKERSLIDIERKTGIHLARLVDIDTGKTIATEEEKKAIAKALGLSVSTVFPGKGKTIWQQ
ncbi:MAG: helix-turn-helix transcriptional regulator [Spirochaetota bacterium]